MPSVVRKRSYGSVTVYWVDEEALWEAVHRLVESYRQRPEVEAVILFGSLARGEFGVGSDVDLLLVLRESSLPFPDRIAAYLPEGSVPVDVDVFPYTVEEVRRGQPLAQEALRTGRVLWARRPLHEWGLTLPEAKKAHEHTGHNLSRSGTCL